MGPKRRNMLSPTYVDALPSRCRMQASTSYASVQPFQKKISPSHPPNEGFAGRRLGRRELIVVFSHGNAQAAKRGLLQDAPVLKALTPRQEHKQVRCAPESHMRHLCCPALALLARAAATSDKLSIASDAWEGSRWASTALRFYCRPGFSRCTGDSIPYYGESSWSTCV